MSSSPISSSSSEPTAATDPLGSMFDVKCGVAIVLGTGSVKVRDFLNLERQSIVRLGQVAGSDLELRVNSVTVATGEVVILDDNTALRISHMTPPVGAETA